ncbi:late cornified envelope-like proline-rich protein 1 [Daphnia pulex]|uniref:late cornified envelope-like proline-rich protein 1 n=1 Tax=Daphnia pulex TaxID=6669 RepID=UPI001EDFC5DD|nr:late cornified envelope-like proline-rich protein 1 [Daphnia pulex]
MKGLSILALMIVGIACVVAQEESNDGSVLDFAADATAMADDRNTPVNCRNCHPHCPPSCVKPPHHHYNHHHYHCPTCPPRPTCPTCPPKPTCPTCPPPITCPTKPTCPPYHCPTCPTCPTNPTCPTCPPKPTCPTVCPPKPCLNPHPVLIGVCLDLDIGIGK